ncbi:hypothetical protein SPRG_00916 [Saprolegnia parasitica CBS 223.65]|uniref:Uncharacterized protein n=1 Tax=Saprolegnia parasitica (strain CBS 223.65) TaxID=695850 RepID=A0A067D859_SAPPC|nr:hypothetical protein SPRG_00916 [Saprolegnia parasitica CBS 223.65]KDO34856.1 hypothetical protein SPRG_00916 [Saprolegnia parasitica CBS 223.65]|eukprot:XP_012194518.1 hypothetical protein SPRG_00916 [Saprolegnia parasitica CBS 223.65]
MQVTSTWTSTADALACDLETLDDGSLAVKLGASLSLERPDEDSPCSITLAFPAACTLKTLELTSSARHAEVYVGIINAKKEREFKYFETIRGVRDGSDKDLYQIAASFPANDETYQRAVAIMLKFLSLQPAAKKHVLRLHDMHVRAMSGALAPPQSAPSAPSLNGASMAMLFQVQSAMQAQLEAKIYSAIDAKLGQLAARLQSSEALVQRLAAQVQENQSTHDAAALASVLDRLSHLENDFAALKTQHVPIPVDPTTDDSVN